MFLRRPEKAGWYLWTVLRSQLEEGADSEEDLWVTDESDTEEEESDSGEFEEELCFTNESDSEEGESDSGDGEDEEREGSRETKREEERDL